MFAFAAIALAACSLDSEKPLGKAAPEFGSKPALSTMKGFVVGKWRYRIDTSVGEVVGDKNLGSRVNGFVFKVLDFRRNGTYHLMDNGRVGKGTWKATDQGVDLQLTEVNGKRNADDPKVKPLFDELGDVKHLDLYKDHRRLVQPGSGQDDDRSTSAPETWMRLPE